MTGERAGTCLRRVAALATAAMLVLSWPLWVGPADDFPRVPFLGNFPQTTGAAAWVLFVALVAAVVASACVRAWRPWFWASVVLLAVLIGQDQHRFQPWLYQYAMTLLWLAALPEGEGLRYARWWFVALYLHSGLSKLDVSFCEELGPVFLRAALKPLGIADTARWRTAAVLAMPAGEIVVAGALAVPSLRTIGRVAAVGLHVVLIGILGPWGLRHGTIVLVWNAAMAAEVWLAFDVELAPQSASVWRAWPVLGVFWAGVLLPMGERWGVWDAWPSHALYASHVERVAVLIHESAVERASGEIRAHLTDVGEGPWLRLDLNGWSGSVRGTPVYPGNRACLGLAEALAARYGGPLSVRVVAFGAADRWTGRRRRQEAIGRDQIHDLGERSWCNAHPWPGR